MALDPASLIPAYKHFQLIYVALRLRIPNLLSAGPKSLDELVEATRVPAPRLQRLLHGLIWAEFIARSPHGYQNTAVSASLIDDGPGSLAEGILFNGNFFAAGWANLHQYILSNKNPFQQAHGCDFYDYIARNPDLSAHFHRAISVHIDLYAAAIAAIPALTGCKTLVDVGGGEGDLMFEILSAHPSMGGVIFDLPIAQQNAERKICERQLSSRCRFVGGSMLQGVPSGGDAYLLRWILHSWDDEKAERILGNVRSQVSPAAQVIVIERVVPAEVNAEIDPSLIHGDLNMLCLNGGAERSEQQYIDLLRRAGFAFPQVVQLETVLGFYAFIACPE